MNPSFQYRHEWREADLLSQHPLRFSCDRKRRVFEIACPPGSAAGDRIRASRWRAMAMADRVDVSAAMRALDLRAGYYTYGPPAPGHDDWHVNFAHSDLFAFYGSPLFAQDEWQVAEHPALASAREALLAAGESVQTMEAGRATPILVHGAPRRCEVQVNPDASAGRPYGLYGREFGRSSFQAIAEAVRRIEPPTLTNIVAIVAPSYGAGAYRLDDLQHVLSTAHAGFRAAVLESELQAARRIDATVHTGFWGCGAFGGNKVIMTLLQTLAASMAGVSTLAFSYGGADGRQAVDAALSILENLRDSSSVPRLLERIEALALEWGQSNGT